MCIISVSFSSRPLWIAVKCEDESAMVVLIDHSNRHSYGLHLVVEVREAIYLLTNSELLVD